MVHRIAGGANVPGLENLMNLDQVPATGATVIALPMKIEGGSGGPVLNSNGEVIGVNFAYMDGFSGSTLGISVDSLRPLLEEVSARIPSHTPPTDHPH